MGRICCDSLGKMNAKSVILEGSRDTSAGRSVPLDLSDLKQYSLFPGQVRMYMQYISTVGEKCLYGGCFKFMFHSISVYIKSAVCVSCDLYMDCCV